MGTTAEKLTYLGETKSKIKDSINLTGANIGANDTFRSYATKLKQGYLDIINNGTDTLYDNMSKVSGTGTNLSLTPTYEAPMKLEYKGDSSQNGTPTPSSPIPVENVTGLQKINVCGKNLFDKNNANIVNGYFTPSSTTITADNNHRIIYIPINSNTTYTIQKSNVGTQSRFGIGTTTTIPTTGVQVNQVERDNSAISLTITTNSSAKYLVVWCYFTGNTDITETDVLASIQIEEGASATTYEPYKGNTYEINLGKNLFNKDGLTSAATIDGTKITMLRSNGWATNVVLFPKKIKSGTTITTSRSEYNVTNNAGVSIQLFNGETSVRYIDLVNETNTVTLTSDVDRWRLTISYSSSSDTTGYVKDVQLELGSQATSYSPYFTPIELNKIGDYQDSIKKSTGKNLFDKDNIEDGKWLTASGTTENSAQYCVSDYIGIIPGEQYRLPGIDTKRVKYYNVNKEALTDTWDIEGGVAAQTITIPNNAKYIRISIHKTVVDIDTFQFEKGNSSTSYEPYGKVWYVEKNIGKIDLSTLTWSSASADTSGYRRYYTNTIPNIKYVSANTEIGSAFAEKYSITKGRGISALTNVLAIDVSIVSVMDLQTNNNPTGLLYYALATPTYEIIINTELLEDLEEIKKSQEGTTNISVDGSLPVILNASALKSE